MLNETNISGTCRYGKISGKAIEENSVSDYMYSEIYGENCNRAESFQGIIVKKLSCLLIIALVTPLLSGCPSKGSSAPPPTNFQATAEHSRVKVTWDPNLGVDYWLFASTDPSITASDWLGKPNLLVYPTVSTPFYVCNLINGTTYYMASNGRIDGGPGGSSSATINATPYNAANSWTVHSALTPTADLFGLGYTSLTTCSNSNFSSSGSFATVGAGGVIFTSPDGVTWTNQTSPIATDLYAVAGYAANQNNLSNPGLRWVAVGAGGASVYSTDGLVWNVGNAANSYDAVTNPANPGNQALRSVTYVAIAGRYYAVGDAGTIISSPDGITWTMHNSPAVTTNKLNGITYGGLFVAVGDGGTIMISADGNTWSLKTPSSPITSNLRKVAFFYSIYGSIYVAVGDAGTIVTSVDGGFTWITQTPPAGSTDLIGISAESRGVDLSTAMIDPSLKFISTFQLVATDSSGKAFTSLNGYDWSAAITTGATGMNSMVGSGFGYVAVGNAGANTSAF